MVLLPAQVRILEEEVGDLGSLNATLTDQLEDMHSENSDLTSQLALLSGTTIDKFLSLNECESLEKKLKDILKRVEEKKVWTVLFERKSYSTVISTCDMSLWQAKIVAKELDSQKEQRLCVICQVFSRTNLPYGGNNQALCGTGRRKKCSALPVQAYVPVSGVFFS